MCGIVGVIGEINKAALGAFENMLVVDAVRGPHSTGVFSVHDKYDSLVKKALLPQELLDLSAYKNATQGVPKMIMGHNRWATVGSINSDNAHPFDKDNIVGMHNGTLTAWKTDFDDAHQFTVDSECLIHNINKHGVDNAWKRLDGAATVVFWNRADRTLNLIRNSQRPMYLAHTKDEKALFFASEPWMLYGCLARNSIQFKDIFELKIDTLMTVNEQAKISLREVAPRPKFQYVSQSSAGAGPYSYKEEVEFEVVRVVRNGSVVNLVGRTTDKHKHEVRCVLNSASDFKLIDALIDSTNFFLASVSYSNVGFSYILPDSIFELIEDDTDNEEEEKVCCSWCNEVIGVSKAFVANKFHKTYLCAGCAEDESVKQYLHLN